MLLAQARAAATAIDTAGVWGSDGIRQATGNFGDALWYVLATSSGQVWVGYFDEASGTGGRPTGVARFTLDLTEAWRYRWDDGMPDHLDCYALNVDGEVATTYAYTAWHLTRIVESSWSDLGAAPAEGASGLLMAGDGRAALIGGYSAEYDVITPFFVDSSGIRPAGPQQRLVLPDGLEVSGHSRLVCRGGSLHVIRDGSWLRLDIEDIAFS